MYKKKEYVEKMNNYVIACQFSDCPLILRVFRICLKHYIIFLESKRFVFYQ